MRLVIRAGLILPVFILASLASAAIAPVSFSLANGLRVIVQEDHRAPVVLTQVWYRVGSSDEPPGLTGLSHVLEHMMFKGTAKVPVGEFSRLVAYAGGDDNAYTNDNFTVYFQQHLADRLPLALELEADRMMGLTLDSDEFARELKVVMEERRLRTDDNPQALAMERFQALALLSSPERNPTIGWMRDLERLTVEDARAWYQRWYAPANATLIVVGDVTVVQVRELVERYFAPLPLVSVPRRALIRELENPGERSLSLTLPGQVPSLYLSFNLPSLASARDPQDAYALQLLSGVLDGGISARLERDVVRTNQAAAIRSSYDLLARGDTQLTITAVPAAGQSLSALREAILKSVYALRDEQVSADELAKVLTSVRAQAIYARDELDDRAQQLGRLDALGLPLNWDDELPARLGALTPKAIQAVAKRYLQPERLATLYLYTPSVPAPAKTAGATP
jgi:zinc protease